MKTIPRILFIFTSFSFTAVFLLGAALFYAKTARDDLAGAYREYSGQAVATVTGSESARAEQPHFRRRKQGSCRSVSYGVSFEVGGQTRRGVLVECMPREDWKTGAQVAVRFDPSGKSAGVTTEEEYQSGLDWRKIEPFAMVAQVLPLPEKIPLFD